MPLNLANIIGGPALIQFAGASFYSKGDITLENAIETFPIETDVFRKVDERVSEQPVRLRFTPVGEWEALSVLYPYPTLNLGDLITAVRTVSAIDFASDFVTINGSALPNGAACEIAATSGSTLPAGLSANTLYYMGQQTGQPTHLGFYDTRAHALAGGATGRVNLTDAGTGTFKLVVQEPLVIQTLDGKLITFWNAAVVQMPEITGSAVETLLGEVVIEAFIRNNRSWSDANSLYTIADNPFAGDTTFDPANILTQPYVLAWGSTPWDALSTKSGVKVAFNLQLEPVTTDTDGIVTRRLAGLDVSARATPLNINETQLLAKLLLQDTGAKRGRSLSGADLNISSTGVYVRLYGAALKGGPQLFSSKQDRVGELAWVATRTFSAGVPNPLFFVGTGAPA